MKSFFGVLPSIFVSFLITAMIIASFAAVAVIGDDGGKAMGFDSESGVFWVFGEEYVVSPRFLSVAKDLYSFNETFLGKNMKTLLDNTLIFCTEYVKDAFGIVYGVSKALLNNCV